MALAPGPPGATPAGAACALAASPTVRARAVSSEIRNIEARPTRASAIETSPERGSIRSMDLDAPRARTVLALLRSVPAGFVTTYGDLSPGAPRFAGAVLSACDDPAVPWQRAVRADGSL